MATENPTLKLNQKFKLFDYYLPPLTEGNYRASYKQVVQHNSKAEGEYFNTKDFCVAVNTEILAENEVFRVHPLPEQVGDFSTELPFIVLNNPTYPWTKSIPKVDEKPIPWPALIVVSEKEIIKEFDVPYVNNNFDNIKANNAYFPFDKYKNELLQCNPNDKIHVITITKDTFEKIMPSPIDRYYLTHCIKINLFFAEEKTVQHDGLFSVIIANRFPPYKAGQIITTTNNDENQNEYNGENKDKIDNKITNSVHLIAAYYYDNCESDPNYQKSTFVTLISLYHWKIHSDTEVVDKSFKPIVQGLNIEPLHKQTLKPHYLRTGEKTYSLYHAPIQPINYAYVQDLNGEKKYTSDGRLIYYKNQGIFDTSYAAAFNLGRIVTLSHRAEAMEIANWRKKQKIKDYLDTSKDDIKNINEGLKKVVKNLKEGQLK